MTSRKMGVSNTTGYKKMLTVAIAFAVTIITVAAVFGTQASDESVTAATSGDGWKLENGTLTIESSMGGNMPECGVIENNVIKYFAPWGGEDINKLIIESGVTKIGAYAFYKCTGLTEVMFPSSLETIDVCAFYGCTALESVELPSSLTILNPNAFNGCTALESVELPDNLTQIGSYTFFGCTALKSVELPSSLKIINQLAFGSSGLTSVKLPSGLTTFGQSVFAYCIDLDEIKINESESFCSVDGVLYNSEKTTLFQFPGGKSLNEYVVLDSVKTINNGAFRGCVKLTKVTMKNVENIGDSGFQDCTGLAIIELPKLKNLGASAFNSSGLKGDLILPDNLTEIKNNTFQKCSELTSVIMNDVTSIGDGGFQSCSKLKTVTMPKISNVSLKAFANCGNLKTVKVSCDLNTIGENAFLTCKNLKNIYFDEEEKEGINLYNIKSTGKGAFTSCGGIETVSIWNIGSCGNETFSECTKLKTVCISNGLKEVPDNMFRGCTGGLSIYLPDSITSIKESCDDNSGGISIYLNSANPSKEIFSSWNGNNNTEIYANNNVGWSGNVVVGNLSGATIHIQTSKFDNYDVYALHGSKIILPFGYDSNKTVLFTNFGIAFNGNDYLDIKCKSGDAFTVNLKINGSEKYYKEANIRERSVVDKPDNNFVWHDKVYIFTSAAEIDDSLGTFKNYSFKDITPYEYGEILTFETITMDDEFGFVYRSEYYKKDFNEKCKDFTINEFIPSYEGTDNVTFKIVQPPISVTIKWVYENGDLIGNSIQINSGDPIPEPTGIPVLEGKEFSEWESNTRGRGDFKWNEVLATRSDETFKAIFDEKKFSVTIKYGTNALKTQNIEGEYDLFVKDGQLSYKLSKNDSYEPLFSPASHSYVFEKGKQLSYFHLEGSKAIFENETKIKGDRTIIVESKDVEYKITYTYIDGDGTGKDWKKIHQFEGYLYKEGETASFTKTYKVVDEKSSDKGLKKNGDNHVLTIDLPTSDYYICKEWKCNDDEPKRNALTVFLTNFTSNEASIDLIFYNGGYNIYFDYDDGTPHELWGPAEINNRIPVPNPIEHEKIGYIHEGEWNCGDILLTGDFIELTKEMADTAERKKITIKIVWVPRSYDVNYGTETLIDGLYEWAGTMPIDKNDSIKIGQKDAFKPSMVDPTLTGYTFNGVWDIYDSNWKTLKGQFSDEDGLILTADNAEKFISGGYVNIIPNFEKIRYSVELDKGDSTGSFSDITSTFRIGDTIELPTRSEMSSVMLGEKVFDHWASELRPKEPVDSFTITQADVKKITEKDKFKKSFTFSIAWADMKYQIMYDLNDGTNRTIPPDGETTYIYNQKVTTLEYENYEKSGYIPAGWGFSKDGPAEEITTFNDRMVYYAARGENYTVTLYLIWEPMAYDIVYSLDGGSIDLSAPKKGFFDTDTRIMIPTKSGYAFAGWTPDKDSNFDEKSARYWNGSEYVQWLITDVPVSDRFMNLCSEPRETVTLKATWVAASYKLVFNLNGGSGGSPIEDIVTSLDDKDLSLPPMTGTRKGYTFAGWSLDKENIIIGKGFTRGMADTADINNTVTLYAVWSPFKYKVVFDDGTGSNRTIDALYGTGVDIGVPKKTGYTFSGLKGTTGTNAQYSNDSVYWYGYASGTSVLATKFKNLSDTADSTITMKADWTPAVYSIKYNANGAMGEVPEDDTKYTIGEKIEMLEASDEFKESNGNKQFIGWSYDPESTIPITLTEFNENITAYSDMFNRINLYALWVSGSHRAIVNLGDAVPSEIPAGWNKDSNGLYYKEVGEGSSMKDIMSEWEDVTLTMDGKVFKSWNYDSATVMGNNVTVTPEFEDVNKTYLIIFAASISVIAIGAFLFTRFERRF